MSYSLKLQTPTTAEPRASDLSSWPAELWNALLSGCWCLIDNFDSNGRRYLVVRATDAAQAQTSPFTQQHRDALALRARGYSLKYIAYELGMSPPSVCACLRQARTRIGLKSDLELTQLFGSAGD